jgi:hypothetical protein
MLSIADARVAGQAETREDRMTVLLIDLAGNKHEMEVNALAC